MKGIGALLIKLIKALETTTPSPSNDVVQKALLYENFLASEPLLTGCNLQQIHALDPNSSIPGHVDNSAPVFSDCVQHSSQQAGPFIIQRLMRAANFSSSGLNTRMISFLAEQTIPLPSRVRRFTPVFKHWLESSHLLWLFDQSGPPYDNPRHLMQQLGLCGRHSILAGEWVLLLTIEVSQLRKPDWIDAEMAFYFDAAPEARLNGWTRCLRTGHQCRREWVCKPIEFLSLMDITPLQLDEGISTLEPETDFWNYHRNRVYGG